MNALRVIGRAVVVVTAPAWMVLWLFVWLLLAVPMIFTDRYEPESPAEALQRVLRYIRTGR